MRGRGRSAELLGSAPMMKLVRLIGYKLRDNLVEFRATKASHHNVAVNTPVVLDAVVSCMQKR